MPPTMQNGRTHKQDSASMVEGVPGTPAASPVPSKPGVDPVEQSLERAAEQVFLSPRVVDQRAFDDLTGTLQRVVREAAAQGKGLITTGDQVRGVTEQLRALMRELQQRTDSATKVLPLLEQQGKRVQELSARVTHEAALSKAREVRDAVIKAVEDERAKIVASAKEQVAEEVRQAVRALVRDEVERARAGVGEALNARAADAERRTEAAATEICEQLAALRVDAARIIADAREGLGRSVGAEHAGGEASDAERRVHAAAAAANTSITATSDEAVARLGAHVGELRALLARGDTMLRDLSERVEAAALAADTMNLQNPAGGSGCRDSSVLPAATGIVNELQHATAHAQQAGAWLVQLLGAADQVGRNLTAVIRDTQR